MKLIKYTIISCLAVATLIACGNDDNGTIISNSDDDNMSTLDFSGTYAQVDVMGRAGVNTVYSNDDAGKNSFNASTNPTTQLAFQPNFQAQVEAYHNVYSQALFGDDTSVVYENNILGLDLPTLTTVLAFDLLQVAVDGPTVYFDPGTGGLVPDGDETVLTGRRIQDDVVDVALILTFGGMTGDKYDGTVQLTSDGVSFDAAGHTPNAFPFLGSPN